MRTTSFDTFRPGLVVPALLGILSLLHTPVMFAGGSTGSVSVPDGFTTFTVPASISGGAAGVTAQIGLKQPAPQQGASISLSTSHPQYTLLPATVFLPAGARSATFTISTKPVASNTVVKLTASYGTFSESEKLTVVPVQLSNLSLPLTATGGAVLTGNVQIATALAATSATVSLSSSKPGVLAVPVTVSVAPGRTTASFPMSTVSVTAPVSVSITARWNRSTKTTTVSLMPKAPTPTQPTPGPPATPPQSLSALTLYPGDDLQAASTANPPGTTFLIKAGVHRMQRVNPKDNQVFMGEPGAILNGSRSLTSFNRAGNAWYAAGQTQQEQMNGMCLATVPRCTFSEDLFLDDVPLKHVSSLAQLTPGTWFFDYAADRIYLADDPTGRKVETSVARGAFWGASKGVTIRGLIIEKYAIPAQMGAIGDQYPGPGWIVENNEVRWNHGTGIAGGDGAQILRNFVHHNGQKGIGANGVDVIVDGNEISHNNYAGFSPGWEAGGTKFALTNRLIVRNNYVHDNVGSGLWTDIDNINTLYENNTVINNSYGGITHEISYSAIIRGNTVKNNGWAFCPWLWGGQIQVQNSQNVEVYNNTVVVGPTGGNGLVLVQQSRGAGQYGPYLTTNNYVHHNDITYQGTVGMSGAAADWNAGSVFGGANQFSFNTYHSPNLSAYLWAWNGAARDWSGFLGQGQDGGGSADTNVVP